MSAFLEFFDLGFSSILLKQEEALALGQGLLLGDDSQFSSSLKKMAKAAGVTHLVAASGANLHFAMDIGTLITTKRHRLLLELSRLISVCLYVFLAGWSGSLWRATVGFLLQFFGRMMGIRVPFAFLVFLTIVFSFQWWRDLGFWLSLLAIFGLNFSQKLLPGENKMRLLPKQHKLVNYGWRELSVGVWVTVFVSFLLIPLFGWASIVWLSPVTTMVSSWVTPFYTWIMLILVCLERLRNEVAFFIEPQIFSLVREGGLVALQSLWMFLLTWWRAVIVFSQAFPQLAMAVGILLVILIPVRQTLRWLAAARSFRQWRFQ